MKPYIKRIDAELDQLDIRLEDLQSFIRTNDTFEQLPTAEQGLLMAQEGAMDHYRLILILRRTTALEREAG